MQCLQCHEEVICRYGLVNANGPGCAMLVFCSRTCMNTYLHAQGYLSADKQLIVALKQQVAELQARLDAKQETKSHA